MAVRLKRVVTRACRTKIDVKQNVQTYIPLCILPVCMFSSAKPTRTASARANYSSLHVGITFHNVRFTLYVFNLSTGRTNVFFVAKKNKHVDLAERE